MSTIRVVNLQHTDATEPNIVLEADGTAVFASGITISGGTNLTVSGTAEFASGTVSAPGVTFIDDNNTGLYSPAADTVAITTAATERLRVDSAGNVLIGASAGDSAYRLSVSDPGDTFVAIRSDAAADSTTQNLEFGVGTGNRASTNLTGGIRSTIHSQSGGTLKADLSFFTNGGNNYTERMRIDSSGNVGINNSSPSSYNSDGRNLVVGSGSGGQGLSIASGTSSYGTIYFADGTSGDALYRGSVLYNHASDFMRFDTAANERMRIDSSGNVGIGTTSPSQLLHLESAAPRMRLIDSDVSTGGQVSGSGGNLSLTYDVLGVGSKYFSISDSTTERMRIDSSGRLLVGTSSASSNNGVLVIQGYAGVTAGEGTLDLVRGNNVTAGTQGLGSINFGHSQYQGASIDAISEAAWTEGSSHPAYLSFSTTADGASSPTERMRIQEDGALRTMMTGSAGRLHLATTESAGNTILLNCVHSRSGIDSGGTASLRIYSDGDVENTNNSYTALSDQNLKENIVDATSQWDDIKSLRVRKFNFKEETGISTHTQIGVIAQEVELVSPGLVKVRPAFTEEGEDSGDTVKTVSSSVLYMKAVKALQEAMERIETLEQRLSDAGIA